MSDRMPRRPATAPPGSPPASTLARQVRSGTTLYSFCAPPGETRKPVTTSSKMRKTPRRGGMGVGGPYHVVVPAVEVVVELDDLVAAGVGAGQPDGHEGGLCAGAEEPHPFRRGHQALHPAAPGQLQLAAGPRGGNRGPL